MKKNSDTSIFNSEDSNIQRIRGELEAKFTDKKVDKDPDGELSSIIQEAIDKLTTEWSAMERDVDAKFEKECADDEEKHEKEVRNAYNALNGVSDTPLRIDLKEAFVKVIKDWDELVWDEGIY